MIYLAGATFVRTEREFLCKSVILGNTKAKRSEPQLKQINIKNFIWVIDSLSASKQAEMQTAMTLYMNEAKRVKGLGEIIIAGTTRELMGCDFDYFTGTITRLHIMPFTTLIRNRHGLVYDTAGAIMQRLMGQREIKLSGVVSPDLLRLFYEYKPGIIRCKNISKKDWETSDLLVAEYHGVALVVLYYEGEFYLMSPMMKKKGTGSIMVPLWLERKGDRQDNTIYASEKQFCRVAMLPVNAEPSKPPVYGTVKAGELAYYFKTEAAFPSKQAHELDDKHEWMFNKLEQANEACGANGFAVLNGFISYDIAVVPKQVDSRNGGKTMKSDVTTKPNVKKQGTKGKAKKGKTKKPSISKNSKPSASNTSKEGSLTK